MDAQELERGFSNVNLRGASLWAAYLSNIEQPWSVQTKRFSQVKVGVPNDVLEE
jgi:hypothetical protein